MERARQLAEWKAARANGGRAAASSMTAKSARTTPASVARRSTKPQRRAGAGRKSAPTTQKENAPAAATAATSENATGSAVVLGTAVSPAPREFEVLSRRASSGRRASGAASRSRRQSSASSSTATAVGPAKVGGGAMRRLGLSGGGAARRVSGDSSTGPGAGAGAMRDGDARRDTRSPLFTRRISGGDRVMRRARRLSSSSHGSVASVGPGDVEGRRRQSGGVDSSSSFSASSSSSSSSSLSSAAVLSAAAAGSAQTVATTPATASAAASSKQPRMRRLGGGATRATVVVPPAASIPAVVKTIAAPLAAPPANAAAATTTSGGNSAAVSGGISPGDATDQQPHPPPPPPQQQRDWELSDFSIGRALGKGKFGNVYLAQQRVAQAGSEGTNGNGSGCSSSGGGSSSSNSSASEGSRRRRRSSSCSGAGGAGGFRIALKCLFKTGILNQPGSVQLLQREIEIQSRLQHRNVLRLFGHFQSKAQVHMILEFAAAGNCFTLLQKQQQQRFGARQAAFYMRQVASALAYCHARHVIHRDIKPENILLAGDGPAYCIKLADFGWAIHDPRKHVRRTTFCGTPDYVAPEIVLGESYGPAVDTWALGVLYFEFLTGAAPFAAETQEETFERIAAVDFAWDAVTALRLPHPARNARELISRLLVAKPEARLTAAEVEQHPCLADATSL